MRFAVALAAVVLGLASVVATLRAVGPYYPTVHRGRPVLARCGRLGPDWPHITRWCTASTPAGATLDVGRLRAEWGDGLPTSCELTTPGGRQPVPPCRCCDLLGLGGCALCAHGGGP